VGRYNITTYPDDEEQNILCLMVFIELLALLNGKEVRPYQRSLGEELRISVWFISSPIGFTK